MRPSVTWNRYIAIGAQAIVSRGRILGRGGGFLVVLQPIWELAVHEVLKEIGVCRGAECCGFGKLEKSVDKELWLDKVGYKIMSFAEFCFEASAMLGSGRKLTSASA